ncbi:hypothetical protein HOF56_02035 [Candidatus Peribacteria bacterium]|jgi:hypothetical protein|nr:hypothetical protein [Candidatus Peribacteria bacterium]MBT4021268.1 hypothetical protein [Candidatus Peribacteria bacterium]MBT4240667.1 hypothetical protein [Candidatus Peribacteria bacterium]MBT4474012.1 hypothetical protein [Candidatus Peribacteria bacterium]
MTSEVVRNPDICAAAVSYIQHHAQVEMGIVLLHEKVKALADEMTGILQEHIDRVFVDNTDATYHGIGKLFFPLDDMRKAVMLSQRHIAINCHTERRTWPANTHEFAQACGIDEPIENSEFEDRYSSVEMVSGFSPEERHQKACTVPVLRDLITKANWACRVSLEELSNPEETGRLFGYADEQLVPTNEECPASD